MVVGLSQPSPVAKLLLIMVADVIQIIGMAKGIRNCRISSFTLMQRLWHRDRAPPVNKQDWSEAQGRLDVSLRVSRLPCFLHGLFALLDGCANVVKMAVAQP